MFNIKGINKIDLKFLLVVFVISVSLSLFYVDAIVTSYNPGSMDYKQVELQQREFVSKIFPMSVLDRNLITEGFVSSNINEKVITNSYDNLIENEYDLINKNANSINNEIKMISKQVKKLESVVESFELNDVQIDPITANDSFSIIPINKKIQKEIIHTIILTDNGFVPQELKINVGERVIWIQQRDKFKVGTINGVGKFINVKSEFLELNETFEHIFKLDGVMTYVDVISKHQVGKLIIEPIE